MLLVPDCDEQQLVLPAIECSANPADCAERRHDLVVHVNRIDAVAYLAGVDDGVELAIPECLQHERIVAQAEQPRENQLRGISVRCVGDGSSAR